MASASSKVHIGRSDAGAGCCARAKWRRNLNSSGQSKNKDGVGSSPKPCPASATAQAARKFSHVFSHSVPLHTDRPGVSCYIDLYDIARIFKYFKSAVNPVLSRLIEVNLSYESATLGGSGIGVCQWGCMG
jgi:hypothetical protein